MQVGLDSPFRGSTLRSSWTCTELTAQTWWCLRCRRCQKTKKRTTDDGNPMVTWEIQIYECCCCCFCVCGCLLFDIWMYIYIYIFNCTLQTNMKNTYQIHASLRGHGRHVFCLTHVELLIESALQGGPVNLFHISQISLLRPTQASSQWVPFVRSCRRYSAPFGFGSNLF